MPAPARSGGRLQACCPTPRNDAKGAFTLPFSFFKHGLVADIALTAVHDPSYA
jgi:hypothetical protein